MKYNKSMIMDLYELTMAYGYFKAGIHENIVHFDLYFRKIPDRGGYAVFAGLESIVKYLDDFGFDEEDIEYLRNRKEFDEAFLSYLLQLKFTGTMRALPEGTVCFPNEPLVSISAPIIQAQLLETYLLQIVNHQSLIATKAARIKYAAGNRQVLEMGARRAHGESSSISGARAAYLGGIDGTSNIVADQLYGIPTKGTMAHSWVQMFDHEYEAFKTYANIYPHASIFLVDTYDTIHSGIPNAIRVIKEELKPRGVETYGIRIDSGDLTYLSKKARELLDEAGLPECKIVVSNALDEYSIQELLHQGAPIDIFGVGERLITAKSDPVFGAVYKLVAVEKEGVIVPKIKVSDNLEKITNPHLKNIYRIYDQNGMMQADLITIHDETIDLSKPLTIFDPQATWKRKEFINYKVSQLLIPVFVGGKRQYNLPTLLDIKQYVSTQKQQMWDEIQRFDHPHKYYVDLSEKLYNLKQNMLESERIRNK
jgi:nicotinate phosphoribosyltransferase